MWSRKVPVLVSAHRGGVGPAFELENTKTAFEHVVLSDCEYVEFDIQRTRDGVFLLNHDSTVTTSTGTRPISEMTAVEVDTCVGERVRLEQVVKLLAVHGKKAHLDFKFVSPTGLPVNESWEVDAVRLVRQHLADDAFIVTSTEDMSVRHVRDWADTEHAHILVGLSLGRHHLDGMSFLSRLMFRWREAFPETRLQASRANLVVAQRHLARWRLLAWAHRHGLPVLVWTVDNPRELRQLMRDRRVWMVTSNYPDRALHARRHVVGDWLRDHRRPPDDHLSSLT